MRLASDAAISSGGLSASASSVPRPDGGASPRGRLRVITPPLRPPRRVEHAEGSAGLGKQTRYGEVKRKAGAAAGRVEVSAACPCCEVRLKRSLTPTAAMAAAGTVASAPSGTMASATAGTMATTAAAVVMVAAAGRRGTAAAASVRSATRSPLAHDRPVQFHGGSRTAAVV